MATMKVRWEVEELANVMTQFDTQKVYRSTVGAPYTWVEITTPSTRVDLVALQTDYLFDDTAGDPTYYYCIAYFNTATTVESTKSEAMRAGLAGYATIDEVREEGFPATKYDDDRVIGAIGLASDLIDAVTGQWFEERALALSFDIVGSPKQGDPELSLQVPIIMVSELNILGQEQDLSGFLIYNRHLTQRLLNPDDRDNPRIMFDPNTDVRFSSIMEPLRFHKGRLHVQVEGVFGYTQLGAYDEVGETAVGSQVPLSYGSTPPLIKRACLLLVPRFLGKVAKGGGAALTGAGRIIEEKTRDQMYKLAPMSGADNSYGLTGDVEVDNILMNFRCPLSITAI